ncbi:MAG: S8 family serine peptidase [bacterium]|nr:S8 family serine peptidase [bacterium]
MQEKFSSALILLLSGVSVFFFATSGFAQSKEQSLRIAITGDSNCFAKVVESLPIHMIPDARARRLQREQLSILTSYQRTSQLDSSLQSLQLTVESSFSSIPWVVVRGTPSALNALQKSYPTLTLHELQNIAPQKVITRNKRSTENSLLHSSWEYGAAAGQLDALGILTVQQEEGYTGSDVTIGVLDDGFELSHQSLTKLRIGAQRDFVIGRKYKNIEGFHGTSVLSVMAACDPGRMIGGAPNATYLLAQVFDERNSINDDEASWAAAVEWCEQMGADVIHSSLSFESSTGNALGHTLAHAAAEEARRRGVLLVGAAGNEGEALRSITAPGSFRSVLAVGATDSSGRGEAFSGHGPTFDGFAKPEFAAPGVNILVAKPGTRNQYERSDGTSFAAPLLTSAIAILWEAHPDWSADQLENALYDAAEFADTPNPVTGMGRVWLPDALDYPFVRGRISASLSEKVNTVRVMLIPWGHQHQLWNGYSEVCDLNGEFSFTGVEDGVYLLWIQTGVKLSVQRIEVPPSQAIDVIVK